MIKECITCSNEFETVDTRKIYCSHNCTNRANYRKKRGLPIKDISVEEKFWSKVNKTNYCWDWNAGCFNTGYGAFSVNGQNIGAHVFSWKLMNGEIPNNKQVNHYCDNVKCVNPNHLYIGTQKQNQEDAIKRGRTLKGEKNKNSILKDKDIIEIKKLYNNGVSQSMIANKYSVNRSTIFLIVHGKNWRHIP